MIHFLPLPFLIGLYAIVSSLAAETISSTERVYEERFQIQGSRAAGQDLNGIPIEKGNENWNVDNSVFLSSSGIASTSSSRGGAAWIPLSDSPLSIQAKAHINPEGSDWSALALGGKWGSTFHETAQLWVFLRPEGSYQVMANGGKIVIKSGKVPHFSSTGEEVEIRYWKKENAVSVLINETLVVEKFLLSEKAFIPVIQSVGFRFNGPIDEQKKPSTTLFSIRLSPSPSVNMELNESLSVFTPGEAIIAKIVGRSLPEGKISTKMKVTDFYGKILFENRLECDVVDQKIQKEWSLPPIEKLGYFEISAECFDPEGNSFQVFTKPFTILPEPPVGATDSSNKFGAMVFPHIAYPIEDRERDAQYMKRIGLRYVRIAQLNWNRAQSAEGEPFVWDKIDPVVDLYQKYGIQIISTTGWPVPSWASQGKDLNAGGDIGNFMPTEASMEIARKFYNEMATRYKGKVLGYEIGNETDAYFWLGSAEHYRQHDSVGIMKDYVDYFSVIAEEIKKADPQAILMPGTTAALPEGHAYKPWLKTVLDFGLGKLMTGLAPHYNVDLNKVNSILSSYKLEEPIYMTEIGGIAKGADMKNLTKANYEEIILGDYHQFVTQLAHKNVKALCKFLLREQPTYGGEGNLASGLLGFDFSVRPTYAAFGTLTHLLIGATFVKELNITLNSQEGWLEGYFFQKGEKPITVLFLNSLPQSTVHLESADPLLILVDVMGNETKIAVTDGKAEFPIERNLPLFVIGNVKETEGEVKHPEDTLLKEIHLSLQNSNFEEESTPNNIPGWRVMTDETHGKNEKTGNVFVVSEDQTIFHEGKKSLRMEAKTLTKWYGILQEIPVDQLPKPNEDEYLLFKISCMAKGKEAYGKGLGYTMAFRKEDFSRIQFVGSTYFGYGGTFDWKELAGEHKMKTLPLGTDRISIEFHLAKSTGILWVDEVKIAVQLWKSASPARAH